MRIEVKKRADILQLFDPTPRTTDRSDGMAKDDVKAPPYPAATKANGFAPQVDWQRIKASRTWRICPQFQRNHLLRIWMESWNEVPAGSWEDDDQLIAAISDIPISEFKQHKEVLMRGWELHADGRLYHPVISELVLGMAERRKSSRFRAENHRQKAAEIKELDGGVCVYCGSDKYLGIDHVVPVSRGGANDFGNLVCCCKSCNSKKGDRTPTEAGMQIKNEKTNARIGLISAGAAHQQESAAHQQESALKNEKVRCGREGKGKGREGKGEPKGSDVYIYVENDIQKVFEAWKSATGKKNGVRLTDARKGKINARLEEGYSADELILAIEGNQASDWHQGRHPDNKSVFDDLELIFRSAEKVDRFISIAKARRNLDEDTEKFINGDTDQRTFDGEFTRDN